MLIRKTLLCTALTAAAGLIATTEVMAGHPRSCSGSGWTITVVAGPCPVLDNSAPSCSEPGPSTGIQYQIVGAADVVATLATATMNVSANTGNVVYDACKGEPWTGIGKYACHERAVKVTPDGAHKFWVVVDGHQESIDTSIVAKRGSKAQGFLIEGFGANAASAEVAPVTEILQHGECAVEFTMDAITTGVLSAKLTPASVDAGCESPDMSTDGTLDGKVVETMEVFLNGESLGHGNYGNGFFNTGVGSCTTRVIGGKVYTWGKPCP